MRKKEEGMPPSVESLEILMESLLFSKRVRSERIFLLRVRTSTLKQRPLHSPSLPGGEEKRRGRTVFPLFAPLAAAAAAAAAK